MSQVENIQLKFKTTKSSCRLFASSSRDLPDVRFQLSLSAGQLEYQINLGNGTQSFFVGVKLNDDFWHSARIKRRANKLEMIIDDDAPVISKKARWIQCKIIFTNIIVFNREDLLPSIVVWRHAVFWLPVGWRHWLQCRKSGRWEGNLRALGRKVQQWPIILACACSFENSNAATLRGWF